MPDGQTLPIVITLLSEVVQMGNNAMVFCRGRIRLLGP